MSRYTENDLRKDVEYMNDELKKSGSEWLLQVAPRNGYCGVDAVVPWDGRSKNVEVGTPRECWGAANRWQIDECRRQKAMALSRSLTNLHATLRTKKQLAAYEEVKKHVPQL